MLATAMLMGAIPWSLVLARDIRLGRRLQWQEVIPTAVLWGLFYYSHISGV